MRCEAWMDRDERTPEQVRRDRLRSLYHEEDELLKRLKAVQDDIRKLRR